MTKPGCASSPDAGSAPHSLALFAAVGLVAAVLVAFAVRAIAFPLVLIEGDVVFAPGDAMYHVRRAFVSFAAFPSVLLWDAYINYPEGAPVPWPPLYDIVNALVARLVAGGDLRGFELVMAWSPPVVGALTAVPVFLIARRLAGISASVAAALLYAFIPIAVDYARVGNPDHHVAVAHLGAWLLLGCVVSCQRALRGDSLVRVSCALVVVRIALLFTWHGSLLYLALAEGTLVLAVVLSGRRSLAGVHALSLLATALIFACILSTFPTPLLGLYSSIAPSRLHVLALLGGCCTAGGLWFATGRWPERGAGTRLLWAAAAALAFGAIVVSLPGPREGLEPALQFMSMSDDMGARTAEQFPLFGVFGRKPSRRAAVVWGHLAPLIPLLPLIALGLGRRRQRRGAAGVLLLWSTSFGALALSQIRYGNDLAPAAAVLFAVGFSEIVDRISGRLWLPRAAVATLAFAVAAAVFEAPIRELYAPLARRAATQILGGDDPPMRTAAYALHRFLRDVRAVTPETAGYLAAVDSLASMQKPEYGIVAHANLGHAIQWVARRPTPTDPFWAYIGQENWDRAFALLRAGSESEALDYARDLEARYVVTVPGASSGSLEARLHASNGSLAAGLPAFEHFRLVAEGPHGARTLHAIFARTDSGVPTHPIPYKLFEIVEGAVIEVRVAEGTRVEARAAQRSPGGQAFVYRSFGVADVAGIARLRVPYPSVTSSGYLLRAGSKRWRALVSEAAIRSGETLRAVEIGDAASSNAG